MCPSAQAYSRRGHVWRWTLRRQRRGCRRDCLRRWVTASGTTPDKRTLGGWLLILSNRGPVDSAENLVRLGSGLNWRGERVSRTAGSTGGWYPVLLRLPVRGVSVVVCAIVQSNPPTPPPFAESLSPLSARSRQTRGARSGSLAVLLAWSGRRGPTTAVIGVAVPGGGPRERASENCPTHADDRANSHPGQLTQRTTHRTPPQFPADDTIDSSTPAPQLSP